MKKIINILLRQRTATAVFFVVVMLAGVYCGPLGFFILFGLITAVSVWELMKLMEDHNDPYPKFRQTFAIIFALTPYVLLNHTQIFHVESSRWIFSNQAIAIGLIVPGVFLAMIIELFLGARKPLRNIGHYLLGLFYIAVPFTLLSYIATDSQGYHPNRVFGLMWLVWTNDTVAYLVGSMIGKRKLFERISPNKTWEGAGGAVVGTALMAWILSVYVKDFTPIQWVTMGIIAALFGPPGDLVESMLKRSESVKDSGSLLPGHGGLLDRFDALLFVIPFAWLALALLEL